jgi:hypothetical protein
MRPVQWRALACLLAVAVMTVGCAPASPPTASPTEVVNAEREPPPPDPEQEYLDDVRDALDEWNVTRGQEDLILRGIDVQKLKDDAQYRRERVRDYHQVASRLNDVRNHLLNRAYRPESLKEFHDKLCDALEHEMAARNMLRDGLENPELFDDAEFVKELKRRLHLAEDAWEAAFEQLWKTHPDSEIEPPDALVVPWL